MVQLRPPGREPFESAPRSVQPFFDFMQSIAFASFHGLILHGESQKKKPAIESGVDLSRSPV
jgi:hypothetical protein